MVLVCVRCVRDFQGFPFMMQWISLLIHSGCIVWLIFFWCLLAQGRDAAYRWSSFARRHPRVPFDKVIFSFFLVQTRGSVRSSWNTERRLFLVRRQLRAPFDRMMMWRGLSMIILGSVVFFIQTIYSLEFVEVVLYGQRSFIAFWLKFFVLAALMCAGVLQTWRMMIVDSAAPMFAVEQVGPAQTRTKHDDYLCGIGTHVFRWTGWRSEAFIDNNLGTVARMCAVG